MDFELPSDYDVIILGTGMTECILAAALARVGNKVLHLERNDYYSGDWAGFHLQALDKWIDICSGKTEHCLKVKEVDLKSLLKEGEETVDLALLSKTVSNVKQQCFIEEKEKEEVALETPTSEEATREISSSESPLSENLPEQSLDTEAGSDELSVANKTLDSQANEADEIKNDHEQLDEKAAGNEKAAGDMSKLGIELKDLPKTEPEKKWYLEDIKKEWRRFNVDLMPKLVYCRGPMVELLVSSDIAKYCEFRAVTRILTQINGTIQKVPCSRADVFSSKEVSIIEKRMLMKLLTFCLEYDKHPEEYKEFNEKPFSEFLQSKKLTGNVQHYIQQAIAGADDLTLTEEGLKNTQKFLQSLGRYGNTSFLWPLYGAGELPQAFCRMCAVFGGVYCLQRSAQCMLLSDGKVKGVIDTEGQRLNSRYLIMDASYKTSSDSITLSGFSRAIIITNKSLLPTESEQISLLNMPSENKEIGLISVIELSSLSLACPVDLYVVHLSCKQVNDAETDLLPTVKSLFKDNSDVSDGDLADTRPAVLSSLYFNLADNSSLEQLDDDGCGVYVVSGPNNDMDFSGPIQKAQQIFSQICPGEEFLPKAPNPEDIIIEGEEGATTECDTDSQADDTDTLEVTATTTDEVIVNKEVVESPTEVVIIEDDVVTTKTEEVAALTD